MARVVVVHGIGQQFSGESSLLAAWLPGLSDGLARVGAADLLGVGDVAAAFYGDIFRPPGSPLGAADVPLCNAEDVTAEEQALLTLWWAEAAATDPGVVAPGARTLARTPGSVQSALRALSCSRFFAGLAARMMVADLKQVIRYFGDPGVRAQACGRVAKLIEDDTAVVVAHSLGSVVGYEALCALPGHPVRALVTLGSPLGIRNLVFDRLVPPPAAGVGKWPGDEKLVWTNLADKGDVVALVKDLRPVFGRGLRGYLVQNGAHAHAAQPYLTARETGQAIADGLRGAEVVA